jgi:IS1 family transposase
MNTISLSKKLFILSSLVEGNSIRSIERLSGVHRDTIMLFLVSAGTKAQEILDREMVGIRSRYIQVDEIWTFVAKKQGNLSYGERENFDIGDHYVFVAIDSETKLIPAYTVGKRSSTLAIALMRDLQYRISTRFQLSTDSFKPYLDVVDDVFGIDIDYGQIHKHYTEDMKGEKRYSPPCIVTVDKRPLIGYPDFERISTSHVERQNLTMRMQMRRFTRLTNAFSKKLENLRAALALHFFHYNFMRIHKTLRVTPAMQAGISSNIWTWEQLLGIEVQQRKAA